MASERLSITYKKKSNILLNRVVSPLENKIHIFAPLCNMYESSGFYNNLHKRVTEIGEI